MLFLWEDRARQLIDYTNLSWKYIHPSDIDGVLEFDGKKLILLEYKSNRKLVDRGQVLLLRRICDKWGKGAIAIIADHFTQPDEIVDGGNCEVRSVYWNGNWYNQEGTGKTVRDIVEKFAHDEIYEKISQ